MGIYDQLEELPVDPVFGLVAQFQQDPRPHKASFILGYYLSEDLTLPVFDTVLHVEQSLIDQKVARRYLPIRGDDEYIDEIGKLAFGENYPRDRVYGVQTVGGTGALYLAGVLATNWTKTAAISDPTWLNHGGIFTVAGLKVQNYPYYVDKKLAFEACCKALEKLPPKSVVLFQTSCHNPTGLDYTKEQWQRLADIMEKKNLYAVLDMAYQGLGAPPDEDAYPAHLFLRQGLEFALTYTCAKNFSIYGERGGALFVVAASEKKIMAIRTQLAKIIRSVYSNPPMHPSQVVKGVLKNSDLKQKWLKELQQMRNRMEKIRQSFVKTICAQDPRGGWESIGQGKGLFCNSDLAKEQVLKLRDEHGYYLAANGRINLTGLNAQNLEPFVEALLSVKR